MQKSEALKKLNTLKEEAKPLLNMPSGNQAFNKWHRNTEIAIEQIFGNETRHSQDFNDISYSLFAFTNETLDSEFENAYRRGIESAITLIDSFIEEIDEYWNKNGLQKQQSKFNIKEKFKGMTMTQKIGVAASIATIISTIAIFFPNNANSANQASYGNQGPNIQTTNGDSTVTYGNPTTNNYYIQEQKNGLFLGNTMLFSKPTIDELSAKKSICTVESGSKIELLGEMKDPKMIGLTWINVKIIDGTCRGYTGWVSKEKLQRK